MKSFVLQTLMTLHTISLVVLFSVKKREKRETKKEFPSIYFLSCGVIQHFVLLKRDTTQPEIIKNG